VIGITAAALGSLVLAKLLEPSSDTRALPSHREQRWNRMDKRLWTRLGTSATATNDFFYR